MTVVLASLVALLTLGYLPVFLLVLRHLQARDRLERDERARDAAERDTAAVRHAAQIDHLVTAHEAQVQQLVQQILDAQTARADEIQLLLQRIQAPEVAVIQHQQEMAGPDDPWPLSDEESAEAARARQAAVDEIERMEREGVMHG